MMKCKVIEDLLPLYIEDVCSDETKETVDEHLKGCDDCRKKEKDLRKEFIVDGQKDMKAHLHEKELFESHEKAVREDIHEQLLCLLAKADAGAMALLLGMTTLMTGWQSEGNGVQPVHIIVVVTMICIIFDLVYYRGYMKKKHQPIARGFVAISLPAKIFAAILGMVMLL